MDRDAARTAQLDLDAYERDNLLSALRAIASSGQVFNALNTGDWVMQIAFKLGYEGERTDWGTPNHSVEQMIANQAQQNQWEANRGS